MKNEFAHPTVFFISINIQTAHNLTSCILCFCFQWTFCFYGFPTLFSRKLKESPDNSRYILIKHYSKNTSLPPLFSPFATHYDGKKPCCLKEHLSEPLNSQESIFFHSFDHLRNRHPPSIHSLNLITSTVWRVSPCHQFQYCIQKTLPVWTYVL